MSFRWISQNSSSLYSIHFLYRLPRKYSYTVPSLGLPKGFLPLGRKHFASAPCFLTPLDCIYPLYVRGHVSQTFTIIEVKTSLGALSKHFVCIELDWPLNARVCNARLGKVCSSPCYLDRRPLHEIAIFDEIVMSMTKKILNNWYITKSNF